MRGDERPRTVQSFALEANGQPAVLLLLEQLVGAVVPDLDGAGTVLALRNLPFERCVVERVVLDVHGEVLLAGFERHALRHGPARERAVALETEVVMQPARIVALHDEDWFLRPPRLRTERFRGLLWIALAPVLGELLGHQRKLCGYASVRGFEPTGDRLSTTSKGD